MRKLVSIGVVAAAFVLTAAAGPASAGTLCVGGPGCFSSIQAAVAAAQSGNTIRIAPGTFAGPVTIAKSLTIMGAGAQATTISGGGPVLTIGTFDATTEPTVSISGVTITGGHTTGSPESIPVPNVNALGGGIEVPRGAGSALGAAVTISNSVVTGNTVAPTASVPSGLPCPGNTICPFARAGGGGIDTWGPLTLTNSVVSDNIAQGPVASDAEGGGIFSHRGALTIANSVVSGNQADASAPDGRFATGGGILVDGGTASIENSSVTGNSAVLTAAFPSSVDLNAAGGGVFVSERADAAAIGNTSISGNTAAMTNSVGDATAFSAGIHANIDVALENDAIVGNRVSSSTVGSSAGNADGSSGAGEFSGNLDNVRLTANTVTVRAAHGTASGEGGASVFDGGTITNAIVGGNRLDLASPFGAVSGSGGGIFAAVDLTLRGSTVFGNTIAAQGASGAAFGGGLYDVAFPDGPDGPPGGALTMVNSSVVANVLVRSPGLALQGGGLYLQNEPLSLTNTIIALNLPDQCVGCS